MATKVIVTGGLGFIGSHTVVELQQKGYQVVIADNLSNSTIGTADRIAKITGERPVVEVVDLADRDACLSFFRTHADARAVIHFAAAKAVGESVQRPLHYYRNNLDSLMYVVEGMWQTSCRKLVYSSSCTVYGQPERLPVTEQTPRLAAECPYGNTKQVSEDILTDLVHGQLPPDGQPFRILALRYFNPIGAHPSALIGEQPNGVPGNLVPFITQTVAGIRPCLQVFGNDYGTPDGTPVRDYIYVCDLAQAHVAAMEYLDKDAAVGIDFLNLGAGRGYSVLEVINSFERSTGEKVNYKITGRRAGDIEQIWADTSKAERLLGWKAGTDIDQMTSSAWKWQQSLAREK